MSKKLLQSKFVVGASIGISSAILLLSFQNCNNKLNANLSGGENFSSVSPVGFLTSKSSDEDLAKFGVSRKMYADNSNEAYLMDGMLLSANQLDNLMGASTPTAGKVSVQKTMAHLTDSNIIWPDGVLKFKFDPRTVTALRTRGLSDAQINARGNQIITACLKWAEVAKISCSYIGLTQAADTTNTVWITPESYLENGLTKPWCGDAGARIGASYVSCASIGRNRFEMRTNNDTGQQELVRRYGYITIVEDHWDNQNVIVHEVGHLLGLQHEYQRDDRDNFITKIDPSNPVPASIEYNPGRPFDYGSIMLQQVTYKDSDEHKGSRLGIAFTIPIEKVQPDARQLRQRPPLSIEQLAAGKDHYTAAELNSSVAYRAQFYPSPSDALDAEGIYPFGSGYARKASCTVDGVTFPHGTTIGFYKTQNQSERGKACDHEFRVCNNGVPSGTAQFATCNIKCNLAGGSKLNLGERTTVFNVSSVPVGSTCPVGTGYTCELANTGTAQEIALFQTCNVQQQTNTLDWDTPALTPPASLLNGKVGDAAILKDIKVKFGRAPYTFKVKTNTASSGTYYVSLANGNSDTINQSNLTGAAQLRFRFPALLAAQQFEIEVTDANGTALRAFVDFKVTAATSPLTWLSAPPTTISNVINTPASTHVIRATGGTGTYTYTVKTTGLSEFVNFINSIGQDENNVTTAGNAQIRIRYPALLSSRLVQIEAKDTTTGATITSNFPLEIYAAGALPFSYDGSIPLNAHRGVVGNPAVDFNFKVKNGAPPYTFKMLTTDPVALQFMSLVGATEHTLSNSNGTAVIRISHPTEILNKTIYFEAKDRSNATLSYAIELRVDGSTASSELTWRIAPPAITDIIQGRVGDPMRSIDIQVQGGTPPYMYHMATKHADSSGFIPHMTLGLTTSEKVWTLNNVAASSVVKLHTQFLAIVNESPFQLEVTDSSTSVKRLVAVVKLNVRPTVDAFGWESGTLSDLENTTGAPSQFQTLKVTGGSPPYRFKVWNSFAGYPSGKQYVDFATNDLAAGDSTLNNTAEATVRTRFLEILPKRNFTIQAFDSNDTMISKSFNLTINPVAVPLNWVGSEPPGSYVKTDSDEVFHQRIEVSGGTAIGASFKIENSMQIGTTGKYFVSVVPDPARLDDVQNFSSSQKFAYIRIRPSQVLANTNFTLTVSNGIDPNKVTLTKTFSVTITSTRLQWGTQPVSLSGATEGDGYIDQEVSVNQGTGPFTYTVNSSVTNVFGNRIFGFVGATTETGSGVINLNTESRRVYLRVRADANAGGLSSVNLPIEITDSSGSGAKLTKSIEINVNPRFRCSVTNSAKANFAANGTIRVSKPDQGKAGYLFMALRKHDGTWYTQKEQHVWESITTAIHPVGNGVFGSDPAVGQLVGENLSSFPGAELFIGYGLGGVMNDAINEMISSTRYHRCGVVGN